MEVLTVSSKGQVVLPASIRKSLSIGTGDKLAAFVSDYVILFKVLRVPAPTADVADIVKSVRRSKRSCTS